MTSTVPGVATNLAPGKPLKQGSSTKPVVGVAVRGVDGGQRASWGGGFDPICECLGLRDEPESIDEDCFFGAVDQRCRSGGTSALPRGTTNPGGPPEAIGSGGAV
jgi:hypothetical protein